MAEAIRDQVALLRIPHEASGVLPWVTMSIGVVSKKVSAESLPQDWVNMADELLYAAKSEGRNRVVGRTL